MEVPHGFGFWSSLVVAIAIGFLNGSTGNFQLIATAIRNVENIVVAEDQSALDVYSRTGICQFELSATVETTVVISMHYDEERPFKKIEGVTVNGENDVAEVMGPNRVRLTVPAGNVPVRIQVVDFYR